VHVINDIYTDISIFNALFVLIYGVPVPLFVFPMFLSSAVSCTLSVLSSVGSVGSN